jgi:hypothetical protein
MKKTLHYTARLVKLKLILITILIGFSPTVNAQYGLLFNGDQYIETNDIDLDNKSFTIEFWLKRDYMDGMYVVSQGTTATNFGLHVGFRSTGQFTFAFWGNDLNTSSTYNDNDWNHWAVTFEHVSKRRRIYRNGVLVANDVSSSNFLGSGNLLIGKRFDDLDFLNSCTIDDFRIWNVERTQSQIASSMDKCLSGNEIGLTLLYDFEDGFGATTVADLTQNGNIGVLNNFDTNNDWFDGVNCTESCTIQNQDLSVSSSEIICSGSVTVEIESSQANASYFLIDENNNMINGPVYGTGDSLLINTNTITETTSFNVIAKSLSGALDFDGTNDYVTCGNNSSINIFGDITLETWVKLDAYSSDWVRLIGKGIGSSRTYGLWLANNGRLLFQIYGSTNADLHSTSALQINKWHHIAAVREGNVMSIYIDGILEATQNYAGTGGSNSEPLTLGYAPGLHTYLNGKMDETRIWNIARSQSQIKSSMGECLEGNETGLMAYYQYEDGQNSTILMDRTGINNGTLTNMSVSTAWVEGSGTCADCELTMSDVITVSVNAIINQTVSADETDFCGDGNVEFTVGNSQVGIDYILVNSENGYKVDGPIAGTGNSIVLNSNNINSTTTYNVKGFKKESTKALQFTGNAGLRKVSLGTSMWNAEFAGTNSITMEAWVNRSNTNNLHSVIGNYQSGVFPILMRIDNNRLYCFINSQLTVQAVGTSTIPVGTWTHVAAVYNGTELKVFVNGVLENTVAYSSPFVTSTNEFKIGGGLTNNTEFFSGDIADVRIWKIARTDAEIASNYYKNLSGNETGLFGITDLMKMPVLLL